MRVSENAAIRKARLKEPGFDVSSLERSSPKRSDERSNVRDRLPLIGSAPKSLQKFVASGYSFEDAHEHAVEAGADSTPYKKLARFGSGSPGLKWKRR